MDVRTAFTFAFRDPRWKAKLGILALCHLAYFVGIGIVLVNGYSAAIMRQAAAGSHAGLPDWRFDKQFWKDGFRLTVSGLIWSFPLLIASVPLVLLIIAVAFPKQFEVGGVAFPVVDVVYTLLVIVSGTAISTFDSDPDIFTMLAIAIVALQIVFFLSVVFLVGYALFLIAIGPAITSVAVWNGVRASLRPRTVLGVMARGGRAYAFAVVVPLVSALIPNGGVFLLGVGWLLASVFSLLIYSYACGIVWSHANVGHSSAPAGGLLKVS